MDRDQVSSEWKSKGFSCDLWTDPPGQRWEGYVHQSDELLMVLEGEVEVEIEGKKLRPQAGEEVFIPKGAVHSVRNVGDITSHWLYGYN